MADQQSDASRRQYHLLTQVVAEPPFVVKVAADMVQINGNDLQPWQYADAANLQFPIHSPAAAWTSALYFYGTGEHTKRAQLIEQFDRIGQFYQIAPAIEAIKTAFTTTKTAAVERDSDYAWVKTASDGTSERLLPARNRNEVRAAAGWLQQHRDEMPFNVRTKVAEKLLDKACEFGADVHEYADFLEKQAGLGLCAVADVSNLLLSRVALCGTPENPTPMRAQLEKLASAYTATGEVHYKPQLLRELCGIVDALDYQHGWQRYYGNGLERPDDVLFEVTKKTAAAANSEMVQLATGRCYATGDLQQLDYVDIAGPMSDAFTEKVAVQGLWLDHAKLAAALPECPLDEARTFDHLAACAGIQPIGIAPAQYEQADLPMDKLAAYYEQTR